MKFFTLDLYHAPDDDGRLFTAAMNAYERHLAELQGVLPNDLLDLARLFGVDDGLVVEVRYDRHLRTLQWTLRCGGLPDGYYDLVLHYEDIELSPTTAWTLAQIARTTKDDGRHRYDVAYHEIDRTEAGGVEHSFLFNPGTVVSLRCGSLRWEKIERPDRRLPELPDRFPEGPVWAAYRTRRRPLRAGAARG
jgi:hypothetical protein